MNSVNLCEVRNASTSAATRGWSGRSYALLASVLVLSTVVIVHGIHTGEFSYNVDESQHAMTGLFAADFMRNHPLAHPVEYAYQYYVQYPALSGVIHWPPLFYGFEGLSFLLSGPTVVAARLTILGFALVAITFWFCLVRELQNEWMAAAAGLLLACAPSVLLFEKAVMLEIPCLALSLGAIFFWARYLLSESPAAVYLFSLFTSAAFLTKQNALFLIPFCFLSGIGLKGWRLFIRPAVLKAATLGVILTAPFYIVVYVVHWRTIAMDLGEKATSRADQILFYLRALPDQLGWSALLLALLGMATCKWWAKPRVPAIMLSWIAACYVTFTLIGHKETRYSMYWIPPFLYFAVGLLICYFRKPVLRTAGAACATLLVGASLLSAWHYQRPYISGYRAVAEQITKLSSSGVILYDAPLPGNFIFFLRANDPGRHFLVLRKALYVTRLKLSGGSEELVHTREEIEQLISHYGVRFLVVSSGDSLKFESQKMLRDLLQGPQFRQVGQFHVTGDDSPEPNIDLLVYENTAWSPPSEKFLRVRMLTLNHDIVVPMDRFNLSDDPNPVAKPVLPGAKNQ
jgi:dolichyl-phosphate-mannose-protein mannosyltransferase